MQFAEYAGCADQQGDHANRRGDPFQPALMRARKQALHGRCAGLTKQTTHLLQHPGFGNVRAEKSPRHSHRDDQNRRDGEKRVER